MKKVVSIILIIVCILSFTLSSYAYSWPRLIDFSQCKEGFPIAANNGAGSSSTEFTLRDDWTPSRNKSNFVNADVNPDGSYNAESKVAYDEICDEQVMYLKAPFWLTSQFDAAYLSDKQSFIATSRLGTQSNNFNGVIICYGSDDLVQDKKQKTQHDYFQTEFDVINNDGNASYALASGIGYTFVKNSNSKIRLFFRCVTNGALDIKYYDIETGVDLTKDYYPMGFYYEKNQVTFVFDNKVGATIKFDNSQSVGKIGSYNFKQNYFRNAEILDPDGKSVAKSDSALISSDTYVTISVTGNTTDIYYEYLNVEAFNEIPTEKLKASEPAQEVTQAPADPTAAASDATKAPNVKPEATQVQDDGEFELDTSVLDEPKKVKGCGGLISGAFTAISLMGISLIVLKKKQ